MGRVLMFPSSLPSALKKTGRRAADGSSRPGPVESRRQEKIDNMVVPDPNIDITSEDWRDDVALTDCDWKLLQGLHKRMDKDVMETCSRCNERWFKIGLNGDQVCTACIKVDQDIDPHEPYMFSPQNNMNPGLMSGTSVLLKLTQIEEMFITRVHCFVEVRQIRGQQYRYRGHVVNFLNNTPKVYNVLTLLPENFDVIIICPKNWNSDKCMKNQFRKDFRARKPVIKQWLHCLRRMSPAYHQSVLQISDENFEALDDDAYVDDAMVIYEIDEDDVMLELNDCPEDVLSKEKSLHSCAGSQG